MIWWIVACLHRTQLTETERYQISSLKKAGFSQRFIAESL
ncbi:Helix-turn-helix protein, partial [Photorhabdus khanii NC19]